MRTIANMIWPVFGGVFIAIEHPIPSLLLMVTIIGISFELQSLKLASIALWSFGKETRVVERPNIYLSLIMHVICFFVGGF